MPSQFSSGKNAIAECDRCGFRYKLTQLKGLVIKTKNVNIMVCPECWEPDQPQLLLGMYPVNDPQAVRNPRPDVSYVTSGVGDDGYPGGGSRIIQWGWNPVGGSKQFDADLTPNNLALTISIGTVTIAVT
tara:strand:- start:5 stop:394 length:390 start_codon:yes stop_codon:yes gene_type:complete